MLIASIIFDQSQKIVFLAVFSSATIFFLGGGEDKSKGRFAENVIYYIKTILI